MASATDFASFMEPVARMLLGAPNLAMSSKTELRFGAHGSLSIDTTNGTFFDHESKIGGGVLDLIERVQKLSNGEAMDWLREHGFAVEEIELARQTRPSAQAAPKGKIVATYDYVDETGELLFQVVRLQPKTFRQRRPDGKGGWDWSVKGTRLVPYRLPDLLEAVAAEEIVFVVEGEKDVENLRALGIPATCNPMGAGKWPEDFSQFFAGARVVIIPDNDESGRKHAQAVGASLRSAAGYVLVLELPDLPPKGDVSDWLTAGGDAERLYALVKTNAKPWTPAPIESRFGAVWFDDVGRQVDRTDWIVKGLFGARDLSLLYGPPKEGKSFLALDLSLSIAAAAVPQLVDPEWFGHRVSPGGVVYVAAEGQRGMLKRVTAWRLHRKVEVGQRVPFVLMTTRVDLCSEDGDAPALIEEIRALAEFMIVPPRFIVVDTLARAMAGGNENSPDDMGALIDHCGKIQEETGAHVCLVHHVGKDEGRGPRGHNSLHGAIDTSIQVGKAEVGGNVWTLKDQKEGEAGASHAFRLQPVTIGVDDDGDAITSCVVVPSETGIEPAGTGKRTSPLPDQARIALRQLHEAILDQGERPPVVGQIPPGVKAVSWKVWREYCYRGGITANDASEDTKQKAFKRAGEVLRARGYIGSWDAWVWTTGRH